LVLLALSRPFPSSQAISSFSSLNAKQPAHRFLNRTGEQANYLVKATTYIAFRHLSYHPEYPGCAPATPLVQRILTPRQNPVLLLEPIAGFRIFSARRSRRRFAGARLYSQPTAM
jgi:hypothetical protein